MRYLKTNKNENHEFPNTKITNFLSLICFSENIKPIFYRKRNIKS